MGLFSSKYEETTKQNQSSSADGSSVAKPLYDDEMLQARNNILQQLFQRAFGGSGNVAPFYKAAGMQNIAKEGDVRQTMAQNMLRQRGLTNTSAGDAILRNAASQTQGQHTEFLNSLPLWEDQYNRQNLMDYGNFMSGLPVGQQTNTHQASSSSGTTQTSGVKPGGIFGDILGAVGGLAGMYFGGRGGKKGDN